MPVVHDLMLCIRPILFSASHLLFFNVVAFFSWEFFMKLPTSSSGKRAKVQFSFGVGKTYPSRLLKNHILSSPSLILHIVALLFWLPCGAELYEMHDVLTVIFFKWYCETTIENTVAVFSERWSSGLRQCYVIVKYRDAVVKKIWLMLFENWFLCLAKLFFCFTGSHFKIIVQCFSLG